MWGSWVPYLLTGPGSAGFFPAVDKSRLIADVLELGLHFQLEITQGKLVRVTVGEVLDVTVDIRCSSPHLSRWVAVRLSAENHRQLWPLRRLRTQIRGSERLHGVLYKTTDYYTPSAERCIRWNDPTLAIDWQLSEKPQLSAKNQAGKTLQEAELFP
jgi:dTDP-4-dehydrorhamnose 3,5-epimerase